MRIQEKKALSVTLKNGETKNYIFETEEKALKFYFKHRNHNLVDTISLNCTNTLKRG
ncbi:hypothetical protein [[Clostridium] colinum]|uniref:hypothetical protein n=1 Tax=[Clostridium] colinum TaxID=36835 RepID=UPI0020251305|nr:hypothetical protein [[Clostridium] colinum]